MTVHFGIVGSDGIAIVGDTAVTDSSGFRDTHLLSKIRINKSGMTATAWARSIVAMHIAKKIIEQLPDNAINPRARIEEIAIEAWRTIEDRSYAQVIIARAIPEPTLFFLIMGNDIGVDCSEIVGNYVVAGDNQNQGNFFASRYANRHSEKTINELVTVAAHSVVLAADFNNGVIDGLDIVLAKNGSGFKKISKECIEQLTSRVKAFDTELDRIVSADSQEFTYAPNMIS